MKSVHEREVKSAAAFFDRYTAPDTFEVVRESDVAPIARALYHTGEAMLYLCPTKEIWLGMRSELKTIGASDAPTIEGLTDGWRTAKQLFDSLVNGAEGEDLSGNELVAMGNAEEPLSRELFALENPQYSVYDGSNLLWVSKQKPWMSCTLDAILVNDETGVIEDLEIKCCPWTHKWGSDGFVPDNYFVQLLWQMAVTGMPRAFLKARLRFAANEPVGATEKLYEIDASQAEVKEQMDALVEHGERFYRMVEGGRYFPFAVRI